MSKAFAFAGGRLGYLAAAPAFVDALRIVRLPYHLSAVTQAVARVALAQRRRDAGRGRPAAGGPGRPCGLAGRPQGCEVADSDANFVLFGRFADRHAVWQALLDRGVLIRESSVRTAGCGSRPARPRRWRRSRPPSTEVLARREEGSRVSRAEPYGHASSATTSESSVKVSLDLDGTGASDDLHRRRLLRPHADRAGQALADRPDVESDRRRPHRRPPHRRGHRDRARPGAPRRRWATRPASAGSATPWCRWTRRSPRPWSTCPAGRTACTPASRAGQEYALIGGGRTDGRAVHRLADPARAGDAGLPRPPVPARHACSPAATRTTSSRPSSRPWPGPCATRSRSTRGWRASRAPRARCERSTRASVGRWDGAPRSSCSTTARATSARPSGRWPGPGLEVTVTADPRPALAADGLVVPGRRRVRRLHGGAAGGRRRRA